MPPDYLAIGHVTEDVWRDGSITPGGTAWFASLAARRIVDHVSVLTAAGENYDVEKFLPGIHVHRIPSPTTTQFENIYTPQGRIQYTRPNPVRLEPAHLTDELWHAKIMHLAPVCDEVSPAFAVEAPPEVFVGVTPQGWLRRWDEAGRVYAKPWDAAPLILARADAVVISIDDVAGDWPLLLTWAARARLFVVTLSAEGCIVFLNGRPYHVPAPQVEEVDPTGAGDIFAATLFISLQRGRDPLEAAEFANCVAAQSVTRKRLAGLPTPEDLERCSTIVARRM
ncbi:MAG: PfkB family carbohydrate kinase [Thermoflexales bacterium]|nr:PfkB family carbohydrate kinase [Thermoflexales bacterium]MDW8350387.1 PfkB family carbohydrate kinase [Anaerolineae bacterium]